MYIIHTDGIEAGDYNDGMALLQNPGPGSCGF